jgi:hypothetical protein
MFFDMSNKDVRCQSFSGGECPAKQLIKLTLDSSFRHHNYCGASGICENLAQRLQREQPDMQSTALAVLNAWLVND